MEPAPPLRFDSALPGVAPVTFSPLTSDALPWVGPGWPPPLSETLTQPAGFPIAVDPAFASGLNLNREVTDQFVQRGTTTAISLPYDTFAHTDAQATVTLSAKLIDGSALPSWVVFDPRTGTFTIDAPPGQDGDIEILVSARDDRGNEVSTKFKVHLGKTPAGRAGLSEQFRREARADMPWSQRLIDRHTAAATKAVGEPGLSRQVAG